MAADGFVEGFFSAWKALTRRTVTEWANDVRILPSKGSAAPGKYRSDRTPYAAEVMDCLSVTSQVEEVIWMAGAQISKSESGNNWVGYVIDEAPGPMLLVQPTVDNAKRYSKQRIGPMIAETPELAAKVLENKSRDSGNTILEKEFPNGILLMGGANSAAGLRSMPIRYLFADEISNWPPDVDGEGDPLELAEARTTTFGRKRKIFKCSTPGMRGFCRIEAEYLKTDRRKYFVPCPHCGHYHVLEWCNFVIPKDSSGRYLPAQAYMACPECGGVLEEHHKTDMLRKGEWRATNPEETDPTRRGYHLSTLYSPVGWKSWAKIARQWLESQGNPKKLKAFVNNVLAETWEENGERISEHEIEKRAEDYGVSPLPPGVLVVTTGVDVQPDRVEVEVLGTGLGEETWSIDYRVIHGDPNGDLIWQQLDMLLLTEYPHPAGVNLRSARTFIDTAGANTKAVYQYVGPRAWMGVFGIKGQGGEGKPAVGTPTKSNLSKIPLVPIGSNTVKDIVYGRLRLQEPGPGYCHFPKRYATSFYKGLTAEEVRTKFTKGFPVREYHKKSESARNEPLDCRCYATAAFLSLQINLEQAYEMVWGAAEEQEPGRRIRGEMQTAA
ncbi:MAG: phage terminase large subunit family protein [Zoogloea sp.]|uniref:phage terminase large subunit family protein n=1 Tax=Zoogloea sp. TaxID=49181 RepID=UPI003F3E994D